MVNADIRNQTIGRLNHLKSKSVYEVTDRIRKLNMEWDFERVTEAKAGLMILIFSLLGLRGRRCWFFFTGLCSFFLFKHALHGWCPTLSVMRKLGVRTAEEIGYEKTVLKMLRGDFKEEQSSIEDMLEIAEKQ